LRIFPQLKHVVAKKHSGRTAIHPQLYGNAFPKTDYSDIRVPATEMEFLERGRFGGSPYPTISIAKFFNIEI
jgi:hypothetical protein